MITPELREAAERQSREAAERFLAGKSRAVRGTPPPETRPPLSPCVHLGKKIDAGLCVGKCWHVCEAGHGVDGKARPKIECAACPHFEADGGEPPEIKPQFDEAVSLDKGGIGDTLCAIGAAASLGVPFRSPPRRKEWAALFADLVPESASIKKHHALKLHDYAKNDKGHWPRWEWMAQQCGIKHSLPKLKPLPADVLDWAVQYAGRIVVAPFAAHDNRTWPIDRWAEVVDTLLALGFQVVILDDHTDRTSHLESLRCARLLNESPQRVAAVMQYAAGFAGNDSGMAHLAGCISVPSVAVCSQVSDIRIFGCYPSVKEIGGRGRWLSDIHPEQVTRAVISQVRSSLAAGFPVDKFASILVDDDRWRLEGWLPVYAAYWRTVRELAPKRIVEIGTRAGYSAWTALDAAPDATIHGFDANVAEHGGYVGAIEHATAILPPCRFELTEANTHDLTELPPADLVYVDGDHSEAGCYADLVLSLTSKPHTIIVDDYTNCREVKAAVDRFIRERGLPMRFVPSVTGMAVISLPVD